MIWLDINAEVKSGKAQIRIIQSISGRQKLTASIDTKDLTISPTDKPFQVNSNQFTPTYESNSGTMGTARLKVGARVGLTFRVAFYQKGKFPGFPLALSVAGSVRAELNAVQSATDCLLSDYSVEVGVALKHSLGGIVNTVGELLEGLVVKDLKQFLIPQRLQAVAQKLCQLHTRPRLLQLITF